MGKPILGCVRGVFRGFRFDLFDLRFVLYLGKFLVAVIYGDGILRGEYARGGHNLIRLRFIIDGGIGFKSGVLRDAVHIFRYGVPVGALHGFADGRQYKYNNAQQQKHRAQSFHALVHS